MAHILIIDDDVQFLLLIRAILQKKGHKVFSAPDGKKGMEMYQSNRFDLVITDMIMPEQTGLQTISELIKNSADVKIIAISGGGAIDSNRYLSIAKSLGVSKTLQKPFTPEELIKVVDEVLDEKNDGP